MSYRVLLTDREDRPLAAPGTLRFDVSQLVSRAVGGPDTAEIDVAGSAGDLRDLLQMLRYGVRVESDGAAVWWGYVHAVALTLGPVTYTVTLDDLYNRLRVLYSYTDVDGQTINATTDWVAHEESIERYGYRERVESLSDLSDALALSLRDRLAANLARPSASPEIDINNTEERARLTCYGWWHTLGWRYYANSVGRVESVAGNAEQALGLGFTTDMFGATTAGVLYEHEAKFSEFAAGSKFVVSGSEIDSTYTVDDAASAEAQLVISSATIYFEPADDIRDSADGLADLRPGEYAYVGGSTNNTGWHLLSSSTPDHVTTREGITGAIDDEDAGPTIQISQGCAVGVVETVGSYEIPATNLGVAVTAYGEQIGQQFYNTSGSAYTVDRIGLRVRKVGAPTDAITVQLCADSSGAPGSVLDSGTIAAADVGSGLAWIWCDLGNTVSLATGTPYWIVISRSVANHHANYYRIGVDEALTYDSGYLRLYDGAAWQLRPTDATLNFRVWGGMETTALIEAMVESAGQFVEHCEIRDASGISGNQYRDGSLTALEEIETLLQMGDDDGNRLVARMTPERTLVIERQADPYYAAWILTAAGRIESVYGDEAAMGRSLAGEWLILADVPGSQDGLVAYSPLYVESCTHDGNGNVRLDPYGQDPFDLGLEQG